MKRTEKFSKVSSQLELRKHQLLTIKEQDVQVYEMGAKRHCVGSRGKCLCRGAGGGGGQCSQKLLEFSAFEGSECAILTHILLTQSFNI